MATFSSSPNTHPRRRAALAAHALRRALADAELLSLFDECTADVSDGRAVVRLGVLDAATALALADRLRPTPSQRRAARAASASVLEIECSREQQ